MSPQDREVRARHTAWKTVRHKLDTAAEASGLFEITHPNALCWKLYFCGTFIGSHGSENACKNSRNTIFEEWRKRELASRRAAFDLAIEIANEWANSTSCSSHDENPCCHVRTGAGIAERLTRERDGVLNG